MEAVPTSEFRLQLARNTTVDPFVALEPFLDRDPFWSDEYGGYWVVTRYEHVREVLQDAATFSSVDMMVPPIELDKPLLPSFVDPPYTQKLRSVVLPHMTPRKVAPLQSKMHRVAQETIAVFRDRGRCDAITEFSQQYPIKMFVEFFGLPVARQEEFRQHSETFLHAMDERGASAWSQIVGIVREQLEAKLADPQDDLMSAIVHGEIDGERIDFDDAVNLASTVFLGGLDTLAANIGWSLRHLAEHPELRHRIIDEPGIVPAAVEEFLRLYTVTVRDGRRVARDVEFHGAKMKVDDKVQVMIGLANRDSSEFDHPLEADFDRPLNRHIAFAVGPHRCLGSHLARHELEVALLEWHAAIPDYRISPNEPIVYSGGNLTIEHLHLEWDL
jgi:cytochrome P450